MKILAFATQGTGSNDELRLRSLLENSDAEFVAFNKRDKLRTSFQIIRRSSRADVDLLVMEGTGLAGGLAAIVAATFHGIPYVFSSGDAIAPYLSARLPLGKPFFHLYERFLCYLAAGFVGWTPYLVGRALTFGAAHAMTAPGWAPFELSPQEAARRRASVRLALNIPSDAVVFGIVGSINWSNRVGYCYGLELVQAIHRAAHGTKAHVLVVGDGSGLEPLRKAAGALLGCKIFLPGRVPRADVPGYLAAMDIGSLPQSVDQVGSFRYTTKLSEYVAAGLPFVTNRIPLAYDLPIEALWRLPGRSPWDTDYIDALAALMSDGSCFSLEAKKLAVRALGGYFCRERQIQSVTAFLEDICYYNATRARFHPWLRYSSFGALKSATSGSRGAKTTSIQNIV